MKKFLVIVLTGFLMVSCTKKVSTPGAANQSIFFQDANVTVENISAVPTASKAVTVSFSTVFESNLSRIELMSSATGNTFCTRESVDVSGNSSIKKNYSFNDTNLKGSTMYYMLRFKDNYGNWTYSNYLTIKVD